MAFLDLPAGLMKIPTPHFHNVNPAIPLRDRPYLCT